MRELNVNEMIAVSGGGALTLDPVIVNGPPPRGGGGGGYTGGPSGPVAPPPHTVPDTPELEFDGDFGDANDELPFTVAQNEDGDTVITFKDAGLVDPNPFVGGDEFCVQAGQQIALPDINASETLQAFADGFTQGGCSTGNIS